MAAELLKDFEPEIETLTLIPSSGGRFEVTVNQNILFSKSVLQRHALPGEVQGLVADYLQKGNQS